MNYQKARRLTMKTEWEFNAKKTRISIGSKANHLQDEPEIGTIFEILESKLKKLNIDSNKLFSLERMQKNKVTIDDVTAIKWEIDSNWRKLCILPENQVKSVREQTKKANKLSEENRLKNRKKNEQGL